MTFDETDIRRDQSGRFDRKTGSAPTISLDEKFDVLMADLSDNERAAGIAIATRFAPKSNIIPVKVFAPEATNGYRVGLLEENGAVYYQYEPDANGVPLDLTISGQAEPRDSEAFRAAEEAAWAAISSDEERAARYQAN